MELFLFTILVIIIIKAYDFNNKEEDHSDNDFMKNPK